MEKKAVLSINILSITTNTHRDTHFSSANLDSSSNNENGVIYSQLKSVWLFSYTIVWLKTWNIVLYVSFWHKLEKLHSSFIVI